ncbi:MAG: O-antigen ligase family protein [Pirellulales bacterium]
MSELFHAGKLDATIGFGKACLFYLLLVGILDSRKKLAIFLQSFAGILLFISLLIILNHHGVLAFDTGYAIVPSAGIESVRVGALGWVNFYPNDTAALIVLGILTSLHYTTSARPYPLRALWLAAAVAMIYLARLTDSRGGFLALLIGLAVYVVARWGKKGVKLGLALLPLVAAQVATERMAGVGSAITEDTGQSRIQFWCDGLLFFKHHPILGIGPGGFMAHIGRAAHNTFIQAFAELGVVGGTLFLGAFAYGWWANYRLAKTFSAASSETHPVDPTIALVLSLLSAYGIAILGLNHIFATHTLLVLGLATVVPALHKARNLLPITTLLGRAFLLSTVFLISSQITARLLVRW